MDINSTETLYHSVTQIGESTYRVCYDAPPRIVSDGLWGGQTNGRTPMKSFLPVFEMQVLVIFAITQICHFIFKRLGLPLFISQMMAGLILGPSLHVEPLEKYKRMLFPFGSQDPLATVSSIGYVLFIFLNGVQMDFSMITRTGNKAWGIALIGLVVPLVIGFPSLVLLGSHYLQEGSNGVGDQDLFVALISHTVISFAVIASLLNELKIQNSELGRLALSSSLVSDIMSITITTIGTAITSISTSNTHHHTREIFVNLLSLFVMAIFILLVCRPTMFWIIKRTPEGRPVDDGYIYVIISMVLVFGWLSVKINQQFMLGAFILGLAVPEGPPLGSALVKKLQFFGTWLFLPIYVTTCMMKVDFSKDYTSAGFLTVGLIVLFTHLVKTIACILPALFCKMPIKDAFSLALILNAQGVVEIGIYSALYDDQIIHSRAYGVLMMSIMIVASIVQWSVKFLYDPSTKYANYQKRNVMSLKPNSELRIVTCIHKQSHISAVTDVIDLCCPTTEHPITLDALHLIELVGRSLPIFVPHRLQKLESGHRSYSDDVILAFHIYEQDNPGAATAYTYTAISPPDLMHEDVCHLALDKVASMIILPFHQRWSIDGGIESDDKNIRSLNCKVLEIAPCSVGILVSHVNPLPNNPTNSNSPTSSCITRLALIYLGGKDDQEAWCLAKRAIRNPNVSLVVYHLVVEGYKPELEDEMDRVVLEQIKQLARYSSLGNVSYRQTIANDGPQTACILRDIVNKHDFFIVGRRHGMDSPQTNGLTNWSDFPELGAIGDLLASPDFESRASILVVQQQVSKTHSTWIF